MDTNANAEVNNANGVVTPAVEERDEFGRMASERIVELHPKDAELVNREVDDGRHGTYDEALRYIINAGVVAIANRRKQAATLRDARDLKAKQASYQIDLARNPQLITDPNFVAKMMKDLGIKK